MSFPIVCTTEELAGVFAWVDRETEAWFEADTNVYGDPAEIIYPKTAWQRADMLVVPVEGA